MKASRKAQSVTERATGKLFLQPREQREIATSIELRCLLIFQCEKLMKCFF